VIVSLIFLQQNTSGSIFVLPFKSLLIPTQVI